MPGVLVVFLARIEDKSKTFFVKAAAPLEIPTDPNVTPQGASGAERASFAAQFNDFNGKINRKVAELGFGHSYIPFFISEIFCLAAKCEITALPL